MKLIPLGIYVCGLPGGGCNSSYLVQENQDSVVLDFGNGAFGNLMTQIKMDEIDAIIISHMHADHFLICSAGPESEGRPPVLNSPVSPQRRKQGAANDIGSPGAPGIFLHRL